MISFYRRACPRLSPSALLCVTSGLQQPNLSAWPRGKIPTVHFTIARKLTGMKILSHQITSSEIQFKKWFLMMLRKGDFVPLCLSYVVSSKSQLLHKPSFTSSLSFLILLCFCLTCFLMTAQACWHVLTVKAKGGFLV